MRPWFFIAAAIVLGIALHSIIDMVGEPGASQAGDSSMAEPPPRPALPARLSERLRIPAWRGGSPAAGDPAGAAPAAVEVVPGTEPAKVGPAPSSEEVRDRLQVFFNAEAVDSTWSREAAETLTKGIETRLPPGSRLHRVECRGTLCRIETSHLDADGFRTYAQSAFLSHETRVSSNGFFASLLGEPAAGASVTGVAYLAREGKQLPGPEALFAAP